MVRRIAVGGMAEIFLAYVDINGKKKPVAIKRMLPQLNQDHESEDQFVAEAKLLKQLRHPNIVETFELGRQKGSLFIAMEYVFGGSLDAVLRSCKSLNLKIPLNLLARIGADVCDALGYIHHLNQQNGSKRCYIHRDISPQNIMLSYSGQIKVMDFGVAKDTGTLSRTRPVALAGKVAYMSPEQVKQVPDLDLRTDIYSLGAVLFELAVGTKPFSASTELDTMLAIVKEPLTDLRDLDDEIPDDFAQIVTKAMEKDRQTRYQDATELRMAMDEFLSHRNATVSPKDLAIFIRRVLPPKKKSSSRTQGLQVKQPIQPKEPKQVQQNSQVTPQGEEQNRLEVPEPDENIIVLTKKAHRTMEPEIPHPVEMDHGGLDAEINLSESEMFASISPVPFQKKYSRLWLLSLGLLAGCSLAAVLYWMLFTQPNKQHANTSSKIITPVHQESTLKMSTASKKQTLKVISRVVATKTKPGKSPGEQNNKTLLVRNQAKPPAFSSTHVSKPKSVASVKKPLPKHQHGPEEPEIEIEQEQDSQAEQTSSSVKDDKNKQLKEQDQTPEHEPDKQAQVTKPKQKPLENIQAPPLEKPSYQAPEVVAKRRIAGSDPQYPAMARNAKLRATVLVKIHINPDGKVGFMKILKGHPLFNDSVIKAVKTWRFSPYTINSRPVGTYTVYKFVFQID